MVRFCPNCQREYSAAKTSTDYVHECNSGDPALDEEDVFVVGKWEDFTGSGGPVRSNYQGAENILKGTRAGQFDSNLIHYKECFVMGSHGSTPRHNQLAMDFISSGKINVKSIITLACV